MCEPWHSPLTGAEIALDSLAQAFDQSMWIARLVRGVGRCFGSGLLGKLRATMPLMVYCLRWSDNAFSTACLGQMCIAVSRVLLDSSSGHSSHGPRPVSRLIHWMKRWGSTPQWASLRARRLRRFRRCAHRSNSLELAPFPCIAHMLTARVPSSVPGSYLVMTFEYGDRARHYRCARAQTSSAGAARGLRRSLRTLRARSKSGFACRQGPRESRVWDPDAHV